MEADAQRVIVEDNVQHFSVVLKAAFDKLSENERSNKTLIRTLEARVVSIDKLEAENERLRGQLQDVLSRRREIPITPEISIQPGTTFDQLQRNYNKAVKESEQLKSVNRDLCTKLRHSQDKLRQWNRYSSPRPQLSTGTAPAVRPTPGDEDKHVNGRVSSPELPALPPSRTRLSSSRPRALDAVQQNNEQPNDDTNTHEYLSASNERGASGSGGAILVPTPEAFSLKRKRTNNESEWPERMTENLHKDKATPSKQPGDPSDPMVVKSEPNSSDFEDLYHVRNMRSSQPEDLSRSLRPTTPKRMKNRPVVTLGKVPATVVSPGNLSSSSERTPLARLDDNSRILPRTSTAKDHLSLRKQPKSSAVHQIAEDQDSIPIAGDEVENSTAYKRLDNLLNEPATSRPPLKLLDSNKGDKRTSSAMKSLGVYPEAVSETSLRIDKHEAQRKEDLLAAWKQHLTKASWGMSLGPRRHVKAVISRACFNEAWFDEAEAIIKDQSSIPLRPVWTSETNFTIPEQDAILRTSRESISKKASSAARSSISASTPAQQSSGTIVRQRHHEIDPDEEPLRARPLARLSLLDFKINPARNSGLTYAYGEVVRNREARKCLPGCTRLECCGAAFRALAADLPGSTKSDYETLYSYLGGSQPADPATLRSQISHLTPQEKSKILTEAKTKMLADKYGKMHRHAWQPQRPKSPPGFWRTEMPSTQEEDEDRQEADRIVREMVEERWREAMKGTGEKGGRWIFRDDA